MFAANHSEVFTEIYDSAPWLDAGFLFSGSQIEITKQYVAFIQDFLCKNKILSVLDVGCGDWAFSRYIDWSGIEYKGIDVVKYVIDRNQILFASPSIVFIEADALEMELPEADLLLCKDVFQHLPNADIIALLKKFAKFKHCLITNNSFSYRQNIDIQCGQSRPLDLTKSPFYVKGTKVLKFTAITEKETLYIEN